MIKELLSNIYYSFIADKVKDDIKGYINSLKDANREYLKMKLQDTQKDIISYFSIKEMSDEEILKKYKHTKFEELSELEKNAFAKKYNIIILNNATITISLCDYVYKDNYISDSLEKIFELRKIRDEENKEMDKQLRGID